jgi:putative methyltransferase (TIGR04325 family)
MLSLIRRLRIKQITVTDRILSVFEKLPGGSRLMSYAANWPITAPLLNAMLGYRRVYESLREAQDAARPYADGGFEHPDYGRLHLSISQAPRPSDYAALFHMRGLNFDGARIFDVGGNVGNLFYLYDRYLNFPADCIWQVFDLPIWVEAGRNEAARCGETRLQFTAKWEDAAGADLLIASGSLHYFDPPLWEMVAGLASKPPYILVNRTPLIEGPTKATVQDGGTHRAACILYNRAQVIRGFEAAGYELADSWKAWERTLKFPGKPECSADPYSGLFLRQRGQLPRAMERKHGAAAPEET